MTRQVQLIGGPLDGERVTIAEGMTVFEHWQQNMFDVMKIRPTVRINTYEERDKGKFYHTRSERKRLP